MLSTSSVRTPGRAALAVGLAVAIGAAAATGAAGRSVQRAGGDWAGWIYLEGGGDLPMRLHLETLGQDSVKGAISLPSEEVSRAALDHVVLGAARVTFAYRTPSGRRLVFEGALRGDTIAGAVDWAGRGAEFEVIRAPLALPAIDPSTFADLVGIYRVSPSAGVAIDKWFWGELRFTDLETGDRATLFPVDRSTFFAGPAMYVPSPAMVWASFVRDSTGAATHLVWHRTGQPPMVARRSGLREQPARFRNDEVNLAGTLLVPEGPGPHPAIVVLGGSGWRTRDVTRADGQFFASLGVAALIYDQRGHGESEGEEDVTFETTARDALAGVRFLQARAEIDPRRIGLSGESRGGWTAPLAACLSADVAFVVLWVPPAVSPEDQETERRLNILRDQGADTSAVREATDYLRSLWRYGATGSGWEEYAAARARVLEKGWSFLGGWETPAPESWRWTRLNMRHDPIPVLERVRVPVIALFGGADRNVVPEINAPRLEAALRRAGNRDVTVHVIPGASHSFRLVGPGEPVPRVHRLKGFAPERWRLVAEWLLERVGAPK